MPGLYGFLQKSPARGTITRKRARDLDKCLTDAVRRAVVNCLLASPKEWKRGKYTLFGYHQEVIVIAADKAMSVPGEADFTHFAFRFVEDVPDGLQKELDRVIGKVEKAGKTIYGGEL